MQGKIVRLDPLGRRVLSSQAQAKLSLPAGEAPAPDLNCRRCHGTGITPARTTDGSLVFRACGSCRSADLCVMVCESGEGDWIAVRDLQEAGARGASPIDALLAVERKIHPSLSVFSPRYLLDEEAEREAEASQTPGTRSASTPG